MANRTVIRGPRLAKQWDAILGNNVPLTADGLTLIPPTGLNATASQTILRMLGEYALTAASAPVVGDAVDITVAIGIVSSDAASLGATALPDPADEPQYPWLYWASHPFEFRTTGVDTSSDATHLRRTFDIRSMRKMKPRETAIYVVQYSNRVGNPPMRGVFGQVRVLLGLH